MFSGMSGEKTERRRSSGHRAASVARCSNERSSSWAWGSGTWRVACGPGPSSGSGRPVRGSAGASLWPSSSVLRKSWARGPSRMLALLPLAIRQDLLSQLPVGVGRLAVGVVLEHGHPLHGSLGEPDRLVDARGEHSVPEVLLQDLDRLLRMHGAVVHERRQDALYLDLRVELF